MNPAMLVAQLQNKSNNVDSDIPTRKMTQDQIKSRRRTTVNNVAERQMFGFSSNNYKNKLKK